MSVTFTTQTDLNTGQQSVASNVGPGDAVYARATDGANWWRLRLRSTTLYQASTYTEYFWTAPYRRTVDDVATGQVLGAWGPSNSFAPGPIGSTFFEGGVSYYTNQAEAVLMGPTRTASFSAPYNSYQVLFEVSVADVVSIVLTQDLGTTLPTRLSILAVNTRLIGETNTGVQMIVDNGTHQTAEIAANGTAGPSDVTASNLGAFVAIAQTHSPNAPILVSPISSAVVDADLDIVLTHTFSDDDHGDFQTAKRVRIRVNGGANSWWNGVALVGTEQTLTGSAGTTSIPGGILDNTDSIQWTVNTRDRDSSWGSYASEALFLTEERPKVVILEPDTGDVIDASSILVTWSKTSTFDQTGYRIVVIDRALQDEVNFDLLSAVKVADTGIVTSSALQGEVEGYPLQLDAAVYLQVYSAANGTSDWVYTEPDIDVRPPGAPSISASYLPEVAGTAITLFAQGNLLSDDSASLVSTVGGWTDDDNALVTYSTETVANDRGGVLKVVAVADGDVIVALTEEPIPVRIEEAISLLVAAKHGGTATLVDLGVRFINPLTGATISEHWVASVEEESGEPIDPEEPPPDPDPEVPFELVRVNSGSTTSASDGTNTYDPDAYYTGGTPYTITDPALTATLPAAFETCRYGNGMTYRIPALTKTLVRIHMVEPTFTQPGQRVFSIATGSGATFGYIVANLDLFATVGRGVVHTVEAVLNPSGGFLTLNFLPLVDNGIVAGIEVLDGAGMELTILDQDVADFTGAVVFPTSGATISADPVVLTVNTVPLNSPAVASVQFFREVGLNRTLLGTAFSPPNPVNGWQISVARSVFGDGSVTINADLYDLGGVITTTADVTFTSAPGGAVIIDPNGVQAYQSNHFAKSIGVGTHGEFGNPTFFSAIRDIGFKTVRGSGGSSESVIKALADLEPDLEWIWWMGGFGGNPGLSPATVRDQIKAVNAYVGRKVITMLEGRNEPDSQLAQDNGAFERQYELDTWNTMRADPATAHLRILAASLSRVWDNVSFQRLGYVGDRAHSANLHDYTGSNLMMTEGYLDQLVSWSSITMGPNPHVRDLVTGLTKIAATELGYSAATGGGHPQPGQPNQDARAVLINRLYLEHWRRGINPTYIYELFSESSATNNWEGQFGFLNNDGSWREVAHSTKAWIDLYDDTGPAFTPGKLAYQLEGANTATRHFILQKRNGAFLLALWQQEQVTDSSGNPLNLAATSVTLRLTRTASFRNFVPNSATRATAIGSTTSNVDNYATTSSFRPRVIEIVPN